MSVEAVAKIAQWAPVIKQGYDWLFKKGGHSKKPSVPGYNPSVWENSYIKNLQQQANTGLTGQQQQMMMSDSSRAIAPAADLAKTNIAGRGIGQGIEGSGVINEMQGNADMAYAVSMAETARKIAKINQDRKDSAEDKLGEYGKYRSRTAHQDEMNKYNQQLQSWYEKDARNKEGVQGISDLAQFFLSKEEEKKWGTFLETFQKDNPDMDPAILIQLMQLAGQTGGGP
tara:strand:+ start:13084 stop:13767 length:684 start_codon:yes stop_codon:yes gene_type:complete